MPVSAPILGILSDISAAFQPARQAASVPRQSQAVQLPSSEGSFGLCMEAEGGADALLFTLSGPYPFAKRFYRHYTTQSDKEGRLSTWLPGMPRAQVGWLGVSYIAVDMYRSAR